MMIDESFIGHTMSVTALRRTDGRTELVLGDSLCLPVRLLEPADIVAILLLLYDACKARSSMIGLV